MDPEKIKKTKNNILKSKLNKFVTRNNKVVRNSQIETQFQRSRAPETPKTVVRTKTFQHLELIANGNDLPLCTLPLNIQKRYPDNKSRRERMESIIEQRKDLGTNCFKIIDVTNMKVDCECGSFISLYEIGHADHLNKPVHTETMQLKMNTAMVVQDPLSKDLDPKIKVRIRVCKRTIIQGNSFYSLDKGMAYESLEVQNSYNGNPECFSQYIPFVFKWVFNGVQKIVSGKNLCIYLVEERPIYEEDTSELPSISLAIDSSTNQTRCILKTVAKVDETVVLLETKRILESETGEYLTQSLSSICNKYSIPLNHVTSIHHDNAANMNLGVNNFIKYVAPHCIDGHCNFHCVDLHYKKYIEKTPLLLLNQKINALFPNHAKKRRKSWNDFLNVNYNLTLSNPPKACDTRYMMGSRPMLVWLSTIHNEEYTTLALLEQWILERQETKKNDIEDDFIDFISLNGRVFLELVIEVALTETTTMAMMIKLCQSDSIPANQHILPYFEKSLSYFAKKTDSKDLDESIRSIYNQDFAKNLKNKVYKLIIKIHNNLHPYIESHYYSYITKNKKFFVANEFLNPYSGNSLDSYTLEELKDALSFAKNVSQTDFQTYFKFRKESVKNKTGYLNLFGNFNADLDENKLPNPLLFWKHQDCSSMKTLALCNFNIPAGTAMVERAFSAHKLHLTSLRTSLKDDTIQMVDYIYANLKIVEDYYQIGKIIPKEY